MINPQDISDAYFSMVGYHQIFLDGETDPVKHEKMLFENSNKEAGALLLIKALEAKYNTRILVFEE